MLPFDTSVYDKLPISVLIYKTLLDENGEVYDFQIVYGNAAYGQEWQAAHKSTDFLGRLLGKEKFLDEATLEKLRSFQHKKPEAFSTFLIQSGRHLHFEPFRIDETYSGYFLTNITEYEEATSRAHFLRNTRALKNNAVLMRIIGEGQHECVTCSEDFARMMEGSVEETMEYMDNGGFINSTHPEDRPMVARILRERITETGGTDLTIRKRTIQGRYIWCNVHYAFIDDFHEHYIYCTYFDVTGIKENERRILATFKNMNEQLRDVAGESLAVVRSNLTRGVVEEVNGMDLYDVDKPGAPIEALGKARMDSFFINADRRRYEELFRAEALLDRYYKGEGTATFVAYTRRQSGRQCFVKYTGTVQVDPITGDAISYVVETEYNSGKVDEILYEKVLAEQYDMITYLMDGQYGVVIGDPARLKKGNLFPKERNGSYDAYIREQVAPVIYGTAEEREALTEALSAESIERALKEKEPYVVNLSCEIGGELYFKRFVFYTINAEARFYLLLKSDYTEVQREQIEQNRRLSEALTEANQASVAKTAFLSRMSHEIRTPMNAIIGLDSIALQEPELTDAMKDHLDKIGVSAKYLLSLINDILDMSRIESGQMTLRNEEFDFRSFLEQINTLIDSQCQAKGLQYECVVRGKVAEKYIGDATKLKQVLINILGNAVKFTESPGSISLTVERSAMTEHQSSLRFVIRDTGVGMDESYLPRLFDPFSQEDSSNRSVYGGSGLGLAISKNIINLMNGDIHVQSKKGEGSVFTVDVVLKNAGESALSQQEVSLRPEDLHVLIVDDDPIACRHAKIVLEEVGISSEFCMSGREAIELVSLRHARRDDFNLLLVDLKMPEQDGVEVTREIRKIIGSDSAIIILTAYSWADVEEAALEAGVDSFMRKPLFGSTVIDEFQRALNRKRSLRAQQNGPVELEGRRILLAEDILINAEIMKQLLAMKGMEVEHAENGALAVELFGSQPEGWFDAVLMDVRMPVMDGLAATEAIRALDRGDSKTVPIIAMTANAFDEDVQRSLLAGMDAHLSKPVEPDRLYETLDHFIRNGRKS